MGTHEDDYEQDQDNEMTAEERAELLGEVSGGPPAESGKTEEVDPKTAEVEVDAPKVEVDAPEVEQKHPPAGHIPKARFDEVNEKYKEEAAERARLQALLNERDAQQATSTLPVVIADLEKEYIEALQDGETDLALGIREKINAEIMRQSEEVVERKVTAAERARKAEADQEVVGKTVDKMIALYPVLDSGSGNEEAIAEVVALRDAYISRGMSFSEALEKAAHKIAPGYSDGEKQDATDDRAKSAAKRNADTARTQPPAVEGLGNRAADSLKIPEGFDEWERIPKAERERLLA